ncbi:MAG: TonB-dependent receptor plug domain-containing protein, partial [Bacteroidales bacterium]
MKKITILFTLVLLTLAGTSQIITLLDNETNQPIDLATISCQSPKTSLITNANGQADITQLKSATEIHIQILGYESIVVSYKKLAEEQFIIKMEQNSFSLDQVVVSATRWKQNLRDIPSKIVMITPRQAALENPQTAADLLNTSGEVFIQKSQQGGGSPMIRGFSTNRLLYTVDGVRMNTAIFRSGNIQNVISLDPYALEATEVIFGPSSLIYGSDAIGGVMSFQTILPEYTLTDKPLINGHANMRFSSANSEKSGHFDVSIGWKKWASVTSITSNEFGNLRMGSYGPDEYLSNWYVKRIDSMDVVVTNDDPKSQKPTGYSQMNVMQKIAFQPNQNWEFQYGFHYSATTNYSRYDRLIRTKKGLPRSAEWYYGPQKWMMNNLIITNKKANRFFDEMAIRMAYQYFEESRNDRDFQKVMLYNRTEKVDAWS